jgi:hypothetical protein
VERHVEAVAAAVRRQSGPQRLDQRLAPLRPAVVEREQCDQLPRRGARRLHALAAALHGEAAEAIAR